MHGRVEIVETTAGTYSLYRIEQGERERYRAGIPSHDEAVSRAGAVAECLHLEVCDRSAAAVAGIGIPFEEWKERHGRGGIIEQRQGRLL